MKKLFLCHSRQDAAEVHQLADELRLRGIVPWVDQDGGFLYGDNASEEARRALREDCFGLLFYATPEAFNRDFIIRVELDTATRIKTNDNDFMLFAVPRGMTWGDVSDKSISVLGTNLSNYNAMAIIDKDSGGNPVPLQPQFARIGREVLHRYLTKQKLIVNAANAVGIQVSTREVLPADNDLLLVDATRLFSGNGITVENNWERFKTGLIDIKRHLSSTFGRPTLRIGGSKHLTTAYIIGKIFSSSSGFKLEIVIHSGIWSTDCACPTTRQFSITGEDVNVSSNILFLEIDPTGNPVSEAVRQYIRRTKILPHRIIRLTPQGGAHHGAVTDEGVCLSMARQVREVITNAIREYPIDEVHLFAALPQQLAVMIGHSLNATKPIVLHEFDGSNYHPSCELL